MRVFTAADIPGDNNFIPPGCSARTQYIFLPVGERVQFAGQALALVVADTERHARAAARAVTATYADEKKPLLTVADAMKAGSFFPCTLKPLKAGGDVDAALAASKHRVTGTVSCASQYHFHMETQTVLTVPQDTGGVCVHSATQSLGLTQRAVARALGKSAGVVEVRLKRMGGAYGGKITLSIGPACATAVAASLLKKPVRCVLDLNTNMRMLGKRHPFTAQYEVRIAMG